MLHMVVIILNMNEVIFTEHKLMSSQNRVVSQFITKWPKFTSRDLNTGHSVNETMQVIVVYCVRLHIPTEHETDLSHPYTHSRLAYP